MLSSIQKRGGHPSSQPSRWANSEVVSTGESVAKNQFMVGLFTGFPILGDY